LHGIQNLALQQLVRNGTNRATILRDQQIALGPEPMPAPFVAWHELERLREVGARVPAIAGRKIKTPIPVKSREENRIRASTVDPVMRSKRLFRSTIGASPKRAP
jgi:hypothetical protein